MSPRQPSINSAVLERLPSLPSCHHHVPLRPWSRSPCSGLGRAWWEDRSAVPVLSWATLLLLPSHVALMYEWPHCRLFFGTLGLRFWDSLMVFLLFWRTCSGSLTRVTVQVILFKLHNEHVLGGSKSIEKELVWLLHKMSFFFQFG